MTPRPTTDHDYPALATVWNAAFPMYAVTAAEMRKDDLRRPERLRWFRCLLEVDDQAVGFGFASNSRDSFHPQQFWLTLAVNPAFHGRGCGRLLFDYLVAELERFEPVALYSWAREDMSRAVRFWQDRGFVETMRSFHSLLDVAAFAPAPYQASTAALEAAGIRIRNLAALKHDPAHRQKLYDLHVALEHDVPLTGPYTPPSFEEFCQNHFNEDLLEEGFVVATQGERYIGMCELWPESGNADLHNGLTGVLRPWRRQGVALAMKVASVRFAKRYRAPAIRTWNADSNRAMLHLNERLGFVRQPAVLAYLRTLVEGPAGTGV